MKRCRKSDGTLHDYCSLSHATKAASNGALNVTHDPRIMLHYCSLPNGSLVLLFVGVYMCVRLFRWCSWFMINVFIHVLFLLFLFS